MLILENNIDDYDKLVTDLVITQGTETESLADRKVTKSRYPTGDPTKRGLVGKTRFTIEEAIRRKVQDNVNGSSKFQG